MNNFAYDFTGIDANAAIKVREQIRKKLEIIPAETKQESGMIDALKELDVALGEHIYQLVLTVQKEKTDKKPGDIQIGS